MPDYCFYLDKLSPTEALQVLAESAATTKTNSKYLDRVTLQIHDDHFGWAATFIVPDARTIKGPRKERKARQQTLDVFIETYKKIKSIEPRREPTPGFSLSLPEGVASLLINSGQDGESALESEQEFLLIARHIDLNRVSQVFTNLGFHATDTRVAAAETQTTTHYLFHLLDAHERRSSFQSAVAGQLFSDCSILTCFYSNELAVFLPPDNKPSERGLMYFCRFLQAAPSLFTTNRMEAKHGLLAAIDKWPPDSESPSSKKPKLELWYLADISFHSQIDLTPKAVDYASFELFDLRTSEHALSKLRDAIEEAEPYVGYRLELRRTKYREYSEIERALLLRQQAELEYKLAYLSSIALPRPTLLRFTQKQLPALADVIRSFPERIIREGILKYSFQATTKEPAGLHFIFIEPQHAAMTELEPLLWWQDLDNQPMRFWLDPFWARYYHGKGNECLVFVPEGSALFPSMHDWNVNSMDKYMRKIMGRWFHGNHAVSNIPAKPIYIFDGQVFPNAKISISVLDQSNFKPLHTRLGWMNDNLLIMDDLGIEQFIQKMASDITRRTLADHISKEADAAESAFEAAAQKTSQAIVSKTTELTKTITQALERIVQETHSNVTEAKRLNQRLQSLKSLHTQMQELAKQAEDRRKRAYEETDSLKKYTNDLILKIELVLNETETSRQEIRQKVLREIDNLQRTQEELLGKLSELDY